MSRLNCSTMTALSRFAAVTSRGQDVVVGRRTGTKPGAEPTSESAQQPSTIRRPPDRRDPPPHRRPCVQHFLAGVEAVRPAEQPDLVADLVEEAVAGVQVGARERLGLVYDD